MNVKRPPNEVRPINMVRFRFTTVFAMLSLVACALSQGGAGGYGQAGGGRGGGFGGRNLGNVDQNYDARPESDESPNLWQTRTAILTPGDRVEYKLKLQAGETVFASVTSDAFDPALAIEDDKGKELTKNDDRSEGDQSPFLIFRTDVAGTYTLKVLSFRSVSGGKFSLQFRTLKAMDAAFGSTTRSDLTPAKPELQDRYVFRITADKGRFYDLGTLFGKDHRYIGSTLNRIVGPTGVPVNDFERIPTADGTPVFLAKLKGDFYLEYRLPPIKEVQTEFRELSAISMEPRAKQTLDLGPRELRIVEMAVKPDQVIHTTISGGPFTYQVSAPDGYAESLNGQGDRGYESTGRSSWFKMNVDSVNDVVRVFHTEGITRFAIRGGEAKSKVDIVNEDALPVWDQGRALNGSIDIGDAKLYLVKSTKSELMQVAASASHFQLRLEIFRLNGELANTLMKRRSHTVGDSLYFPDAGTFLVRISCDGDGGSGDFDIKRDTVSATPSVLGAEQTIKLSGEDFGLYSFDLIAGKRYELLNDRTDSYLRADLLDDDGQFLISNGVSFDKVDVQYFIPTKTGKHRLWLRGGAGTHKFRFEANVPPVLGK